MGLKVMDAEKLASLKDVVRNFKKEQDAHKRAQKAAFETKNKMDRRAEQAGRLATQEVVIRIGANHFLVKPAMGAKAQITQVAVA